VGYFPLSDVWVIGRGCEVEDTSIDWKEKESDGFEISKKNLNI
jgi:hypothetical protein